MCVRNSTACTSWPGLGGEVFKKSQGPWVLFGIPMVYSVLLVGSTVVLPVIMSVMGQWTSSSEMELLPYSVFYLRRWVNGRLPSHSRRSGSGVRRS